MSRPTDADGLLPPPEEDRAPRPAPPGGAGQRTRPGKLRRFARTVWRNKTGSISVLLILLIAGACLFADFLTPFEPNQQSIVDRLAAPGTEGANGTYLLGSDTLGRDVLTRLLHGGRVSLMIAGIAVLVSLVAGVVLGITAGHFGGWFDTFVMRLVDMQLAIPTLILGLGVMAIFGPTLRNVIFVLALTGWVHYARIVRAEVLSVREKEYMLAARSIGARHNRQIWVHVLPNVMASVIVLTSLRFGSLIILEATLSFLGLGVQPPTPTWGNMISGGREVLASAWWISTLPGLALSAIVIAFNLGGDWLRDVLDPRVEAE